MTESDAALIGSSSSSSRKQRKSDMLDKHDEAQDYEDVTGDKWKADIETQLVLAPA